jgi:hypothetical protein
MSTVVPRNGTRAIPAFPTPEYFDEKVVEVRPGMLLRDSFAERALPFCCIHHSQSTLNEREHAQRAAVHAYLIADAMLAAREMSMTPAQRAKLQHTVPHQPFVAVRPSDDSCLRGRPPFAPLRRAAAAFAALRFLPPLRPSETAAGFLRGTAPNRQRSLAQCLARLVGWHGVGDAAGAADDRRDDFGSHAVALCPRLARTGRADHEAIGEVAVARVLDFIEVRHGRNIPNRLGFVKW